MLGQDKWDASASSSGDVNGSAYAIKLLTLTEHGQTLLPPFALVTTQPWYISPPRGKSLSQLSTFKFTRLIMPRSDKKALVLCLFQSLAGVIFGWGNSEGSGLVRTITSAIESPAYVVSVQHASVPAQVWRVPGWRIRDQHNKAECNHWSFECWCSHRRCLFR